MSRGFVFRCAHIEEGVCCSLPADYLVWYAGYGGIYTYRCTLHVIEDLKNTEWRVACIRHITEAIYDIMSTNKLEVT